MDARAVAKHFVAARFLFAKEKKDDGTVSHCRAQRGEF
jgi:hypothetical protein